jgi:colanic acid/amylovoran biosynthesis glycosyltransferase
VKLGYLTSQYPAPSHTFIRREVEALERRGLRVHTFSVRPPALPTPVCPEDARAARRTSSILPVRPLRLLESHVWAALHSPRSYAGMLGDALRHRAPGATSLIWSMFHFAEAAVLARELHRRSITHLHNHFANSGANVGYLAARYLGIGWSLTLHGISELDYPAGLLLADKIAAARFVACASHFGRAQAMRVCEPSEWPKLRIVRCGVPTHAVPVPSPRSPDEPLRLLHVGRLAPEKGQHGLLDALGRALRRGADVRLRIAGDGPLQGALRREAHALGLGDHVTFLGRLPEAGVRSEMAIAHGFVLSSFMEGLPVVLMEAMAAGLPVIAPRVAGVPELVEDGCSGLLFDPSDWEGLAERICALAADPAMGYRLAVAGQRRALEGFDIDHVVEPLFEELQRLSPPAPVVPFTRRSALAQVPKDIHRPHPVREAGQLGGQVEQDEGDAVAPSEPRARRQ